MGAITINRTLPALTGSVTIADSKMTENMRLFGLARIPGFTGLTNQQKADAIAAELYVIVKEIAWHRRQIELKEARQVANAVEDAAAYEEL